MTAEALSRAVLLPRAHRPAAREAGRLRAWRIGPLGGLVDISCCAGPTVLALLGIVGVGTAFAWATDVYGAYAWWFRLAGLAAAGLLVWHALRRRDRCSLAAVRRALPDPSVGGRHP